MKHANGGNKGDNTDDDLCHYDDHGGGGGGDDDEEGQNEEFWWCWLWRPSTDPIKLITPWQSFLKQSCNDNCNTYKYAVIYFCKI